MGQAFFPTMPFKNKRSEKLKIGASFGYGAEHLGRVIKKKGERSKKCQGNKRGIRAVAGE